LAKGFLLVPPFRIVFVNDELHVFKALFLPLAHLASQFTALLVALIILSDCHSRILLGVKRGGKGAELKLGVVLDHIEVDEEANEVARVGQK